MDDGDEPQIVSYTENIFKCNVCDASLATVTVEGRQAHYEAHLEEEALNRLQATPSYEQHFVDLCDEDGENLESRSPSTTPKIESNKDKRENEGSETRWHVFWYHSEGTPPPDNFTPGIVPLLRRALLKSHEKGQTVRAVLCYRYIVHVCAQRDFTWSCGYRNFLMACTALVHQQIQPSYAAALGYPTIRKLQEWIEEAWKAGIDEEGAIDLKHKLVGTKKWIGTAELHVAFQTRGIPSKLVDFPRVDPGADIVIRWIERYFTSPHDTPQPAVSQPAMKTSVDEALRGASPVILTDCMPIILQHKGHSRTIVGYERLKNGSVNLLCFDPARKIKDNSRKAALTLVQTSLALAPTQSKARPADPKRKNILSTKLFHRILHPRKRRLENDEFGSLSTKKKRCLVEPSLEDCIHKLKRMQGGLHATGSREVVGENDHHEIINIDSDELEDDSVAHTVEDTNTPKAGAHKSRVAAGSAVDVDYAKVLDFFRLKPRIIGKQDRYQILHFPLDGLLSEEERWAKRVVTSEIIIMNDESHRHST